MSRWKQPKTAKLLLYSIREVEEDIADCYIICIAQIIRLLLKFIVVIFVFVQLYKGYADDARNTDNAWLETHVINYHDDDLFRNVELRVGQSCIFFVLDSVQLDNSSGFEVGNCIVSLPKKVHSVMLVKKGEKQKPVVNRANCTLSHHQLKYLLVEDKSNNTFNGLSF